jgi:two-component system cell cycle sensor histidine kinase/response regulator CckA
MAPQPLRALIVEDSENDMEILVRALERGGYAVASERVETADAMAAALGRTPWDIVLSDFSMPQFSGPAALALLKGTGRDIPFIMISGTIGEEAAVLALKAGAHDFFVKGRLALLVPAIERELRDVAARRERERLEEQLRQGQKMEAIGQLAGGIAHDFNNMLTAILGYSALIAEQIGPDKPIGQDIREIVAAAERATALTRQLLAFSRKQLLTVMPVNLTTAVRTVEPMLRRLIGEQITVTTALADALHPVLADATQLDQVLMNLCVNARDAMPQGGTLTIETRDAELDTSYTLAHRGAKVGSYALLTVADTGVGMTPEVQARIFEPFFTTKERGRGTGLGLAAVYGIVKQLDGYIAVESAPGRGTAFHVYLPRTERPAAQPIVPASAAASWPGHETILLVEDEESVRQFAKIALQRYGYRVVEAHSAEAALALLDSVGGSLDLLLSDVILSGMDGCELARCVTRDRPDLRVLFMSGYTERMSTVNSVLDRGVQLLEKPFTAQALLMKIRQVLGDSVPSTPSRTTEATAPPRV